MSPSEELYGLERLSELIKATPPTAAALGRTILEDVRRHADGRAQNDDITLLCVARTG
jgi:sigma-B regulation protein RsbU (phosphoserine phosphatase)